MEQLCYIYVLRSLKDGKNYTGYTKNLKLFDRIKAVHKEKVEFIKMEE